MGTKTQTGQLLSDLLKVETPTPSQVIRWIAQLNDQVQALHATGRLHREIRSNKIWINQFHNASLQPAARQKINCGAAHAADQLPPELETIAELKLSDQIASVQNELKSHDAQCDPCRIDIYQLGVLALKLLTGTSVSQYLVNPKTKSAVPRQWQAWIDSAIGYSPAKRIYNCDQLEQMLDELMPTGAHDTDLPTPPVGTGIDVLRDTPASGNIIAATPPASGSADDPESGGHAPLPFDKLGQYRIDGPLGSGGMGDVYRAYDPRLDRNVAIKVLPTELSRDAQFVERFTSEARAVAKLTHPHIVPVYDFGHDQGHHFFVMELVEGRSLAQLLKQEGRLSADRALELVKQIASGLGEAHRRDLIHRDIKPSNILLSGETNTAKLADFGLVKSLNNKVDGTATGIVMGTVDYIAPEQGQGKPVDGRADLYSLGVLLYHLISGRLPFVADSPTAMIFQHAYEQPTALREVAPLVSPEVEAVIERLMSKAPDDRYQSAEDLIGAIQALPTRQETAYFKAPTGSDSRRSEIVLAPQFDDSLDELDAPPVGEFVPAIDQGPNTRALALFNEHAPAALVQLQNTEQQIAGGIAVYTSRRNQLAALHNQALGVEEALSRQISEQQSAATSAARRVVDARDSAEKANAKALQSQHLETIEVLKQQLADQKEQRVQMDDRLAKADARLQQMRSQQKLLLARLEKARATAGDVMDEATACADRIFLPPRPAGRSPKVIASIVAGTVFLLGMYGLFRWSQNFNDPEGSVRTPPPSIVSAPQGDFQQQIEQRVLGKEFWILNKEGALEIDSRIIPSENGKWREGAFTWQTVGYELDHVVLYDESRDYRGKLFDNEFHYQSPGNREKNAWKIRSGKWSGFGTATKISAVNSGSKAFGFTRSKGRLSGGALSNFNVAGSDKLVVAVMAEIRTGEVDSLTVTYAGRAMELAVKKGAKTHASIYFLDQPSDVAAVGDVTVEASEAGALNGVGIYATALVGTADGLHRVAVGKTGDPCAEVNIASPNTFVLATAASNDLSVSTPSGSVNSIVSVEAPFSEVGNYNGHGNEIGSALAATAEFHSTAPGTYKATFPGLSNRNNRETVVIAAFSAEDSTEEK